MWLQVIDVIAIWPLKKETFRIALLPCSALAFPSALPLACAATLGVGHATNGYESAYLNREGITACCTLPSWKPNPLLLLEFNSSSSVPGRAGPRERIQKRRAAASYKKRQADVFRKNFSLASQRGPFCGTRMRQVCRRQKTELTTSKCVAVVAKTLCCPRKTRESRQGKLRVYVAYVSRRRRSGFTRTFSAV